MLEIITSHQQITLFLILRLFLIWGLNVIPCVYKSMCINMSTEILKKKHKKASHRESQNIRKL